MRRALIAAVSAGAMLVATGVAVATLAPGGTTSASATFTAEKTRAETRTCTGVDGKYEITRGLYTGASTSTEAALAGPIVLAVKSVYNVDEKLGWIEGSLRIGKGDDDRRSGGRFWATLGDAGAVNGFFNGRASLRHAVVFSGLTASFTPAGGFLNGKLGGGGAQVNAAVLAGNPCTGDGKRPGTAVRLEVKGAVSALTNTSITVTPRDGSAAQTCERVDGKSPRLDDNVKVGTNVEMGCALVDGKMTLLKLKAHR